MTVGLGVVFLLLIASVSCTSGTDSKYYSHWKHSYADEINLAAVISFLRTFWNLNTLLSWPDPNSTDICDNINLFPGLTCDITLNIFIIEM